MWRPVGRHGDGARECHSRDSKKSPQARGLNGTVHPPGGPKSAESLIGLNHGVGQAVFLLESLGENLFSCLFWVLEAASFLGFGPLPNGQSLQRPPESFSHCVTLTSAAVATSPSLTLTKTLVVTLGHPSTLTSHEPGPSHISTALLRCKGTGPQGPGIRAWTSLGITILPTNLGTLRPLFKPQCLCV